MMNITVGAIDFFLVVVAGVTISLLLSKLLNHGQRGWWKLPVSLMVNMVFAVSYLYVLNQGTLLHWAFERGISRFAQPISATSFVLVLFHSWMGARVP